MVVRGGAGHAALDDSAVHDPATAALRHRVHVTEDPAMSAVAPAKRPARVTVTLKDSRADTEEVESHRATSIGRSRRRSCGASSANWPARRWVRRASPWSSGPPIVAKTGKAWARCPGSCAGRSPRTCGRPRGERHRESCLGSSRPACG
ncbi:MAG: MmgE/PrpD family protein [Acetobacteraceae bacterium]|nr:MmgE/PrpD family protein [Acetobacteraceae bacterium]